MNYNKYTLKIEIKLDNFGEGMKTEGKVVALWVQQSNSSQNY